MTEHFQIGALRALVEVATQGSLTGAAASLGQAQPNVSRAIAGLERDFGVTLFRRTTRGSVPTPEGLVVIEWARDLLRRIDQFSENVRGLTSNGVTEFSVAASQTIAEHLLPRWLAGFREANPGSKVAVNVMNSEAVIAAVAAGEVSLGFVEGTKPPSFVNSTTVADDELVLVVDPFHPWTLRTDPISKHDLVSGGLVTREVGSGTRKVLDEALGGELEPELQLGSNTAVRTAVLTGAGAAVLSRLAVADTIASGELVELPMDIGPLKRKLRVVWVGPKRLTGPSAGLVEIACE